MQINLFGGSSCWCLGVCRCHLSLAGVCLAKCRHRAGGSEHLCSPTPPSARAGPQTQAGFILVRHTCSMWDGSAQLAAPKTASRNSCGCQAAKGTAQLMWNPHPRAGAAASQHCCSPHTQNNQIWMEWRAQFYRAQFYSFNCLWVPFRLSVWVWTWIENTWEFRERNWASLHWE